MTINIRTILQGSSNWYFVINEDGSFGYANKGLFTFSKKSLEQEGLDLFDQLLDDDNKIILALELKAVNDGSQRRIFDLQIINTELDEKAYFKATAWPIKNKQISLQLEDQTEYIKKELMLDLKEKEIDLLMNSFFKKRQQVVNEQYYQQLLRTIMLAVEAEYACIYAQDQKAKEYQLIASIFESVDKRVFNLDQKNPFSKERTELFFGKILKQAIGKRKTDINSVVASPIKLHSGKMGYLIVGSVNKYNFDWKKIRLINKSALALSNLLSIDMVYWEQKKIEKMKDQFLSLVSHELRSPITVVKGNVSLIKKIKSEQELNDTINIVDRSLNRLNRLVDDILEVTRIQYGEVDFNVAGFDVKKCLKDFADEEKQNLMKKGVQLSIEGLTIKIFNDRDRLVQIFSNLLSNSLKNVASDNPKIIIDIKDKGERVKISFKDNGLGMSKNQQKEIFKRFYKANEAKPGAGLGLAIVHELVLKMKGKILVKSKKNEGAEFIIILPKRIES